LGKDIEDGKEVKLKILRKFPKEGNRNIYLLLLRPKGIWCASLADEMIKMGFTNVKQVHGGGQAMENISNIIEAGK